MRKSPHTGYAQIWEGQLYAMLGYGRSGLVNLEPCTTAVSSPQSNGMAERFVKTMNENYIAFMPKPDVRTALRNLATAFVHYNKNHPQSALGYHSPREYRRQRASLTLDTKAVWT